MNFYLVFIKMISAIEAFSADLDYGKHYQLPGKYIKIVSQLCNCIFS